MYWIFHRIFNFSCFYVPHFLTVLQIVGLRFLHNKDILILVLHWFNSCCHVFDIRISLHSLTHHVSSVEHIINSTSNRKLSNHWKSCDILVLFHISHYVNFTLLYNLLGIKIFKILTMLLIMCIILQVYLLTYAMVESHHPFITLTNFISYPFFAGADTGIYPHAASQYHVWPKAKRGIGT